MMTPQEVYNISYVQLSQNILLEQKQGYTYIEILVGHYPQKVVDQIINELNSKGWKAIVKQNCDGKYLIITE